MNSTIFSEKQTFFDRWAPNYDFFLTSAIFLAIHQRMLEYAQIPDEANILDIGCGTGRLLDRLAKEYATLRGIGLDLSQKMILEARKRNLYADRIEYRQGNAESLPFGDSKFDVVFNMMSFPHYPHPQTVLSEICRVLRSGGRFYLVDITPPPNVKVRQQTNADLFLSGMGGVRFYSLPQRERLGREAGLNFLGHRYLLGPVVLTMFARS